MAAILCGTDDQRARAQRSRDRLMATTRGEVVTPVRALDRFHLAEDYHQKHALRRHALMREVETLSAPELVDSTLAARLNGFVAGHGTPALVDELVTIYRLSVPTRDQLRALCRGRT